MAPAGFTVPQATAPGGVNQALSEQVAAGQQGCVTQAQYERSDGEHFKEGENKKV